MQGWKMRDWKMWDQNRRGGKCVTDVAFPENVVSKMILVEMIGQL